MGSWKRIQGSGRYKEKAERRGRRVLYILRVRKRRSKEPSYSSQEINEIKEKKSRCSSLATVVATSSRACIYQISRHRALQRWVTRWTNRIVDAVMFVCGTFHPALFITKIPCCKLECIRDFTDSNGPSHAYSSSSSLRCARNKRNIPPFPAPHFFSTSHLVSESAVPKTDISIDRIGSSADSLRRYG